MEPWYLVYKGNIVSHKFEGLDAAVEYWNGLPRTVFLDAKLDQRALVPALGAGCFVVSKNLIEVFNTKFGRVDPLTKAAA